ncbi:hypothetical protein ACP70R_012172 [Stipagrostis hirtigluma subsp. patula]
MAAGKHRIRLRCLTLARIAAASVVALAFAATMVVVVLTAGLRSNNVRLSVTQGHILSAGPLWSAQGIHNEHLWRPLDETIAIYAPAKELTVWISMDAHDPNGRAANICVSSVHIIDMPHAPSFDGMVDIANISNMVATGSADKPCAPWHPRHNGSPFMQLDRWVPVDNPLMLCYISQKYGGVNDFTVMLKVNMTMLYKEEEGHPPENHTDTHYCWPVKISNSRFIHSEDVTCKPSNAIDYTSDVPVLDVNRDLTPRQRFICNQWSNNPEI